MRPLVRHLYVHIPFCTHICPYCAFHKERNVGPELSAFVPALIREIEWADRNFDLKPETFFFGGGTPSALSVSQWEALFEAWPWSGAVEFTVEANPLTVSARKAEVLRRGGVNRISLGVQAFDDGLLKTLGRTHRREGVYASIAGLRRAGFSNINIDLMFSLPGQTPEVWRATLEEAVGLGPEHISTYNLTYEEDTPYLQRFTAGEFRQEEETNRVMAAEAAEILPRAGYRQYEISNFARAGFESSHNLAVWRGADYLGLGPSACSTVAGRRWKNLADTANYVSSLSEQGVPPQEFEEWTEQHRRQEAILLALRTDEGVKPEWVEGKAALPDLLAEGLMERANGRLRLTARGRLVADSVSEWLI